MSALAVTPSTGVGVQISGVTKSFGATEVLRGVDLAMSPGEFVVLLGPSGSGKSTLARCLAGVERISSGEVRIGETLVDDGRNQVPPEKRNLAMVFQDYALWPHMTVAENVGYPLRRQRLDGRQRSERTARALTLAGLPHLAQRYPGQLSGGQQQRVALARAIVGNPGLLIFDEPLSNLDADLRERLRVEIASLTRECGATAVYITHDQAEAFALADRVAILEEGRLVQLGTPEDVYYRPSTPFVARFTGTATEWHGRVLSVSPGACVVDVEGQSLFCTYTGALEVGQPCTVLVRPHAAELDCVGPDSTLDGVVSDVAFRGRGYDHVVQTPLGKIAGVHSPSSHGRQARVRLHLASRGCLAFATTN